MISFNWPIIITTSALLYVLIILTLPFSSVTATILLFSLIAFWSRLPGLCIYEPISILYLMDFVDIFSIIIAIYINPFYGALFSIIWNLYPRLAGAYKTWLALTKDAGVQAFITLLCPLFYTITGDLATVVIIYSVLRFIIYGILNIFVPSRGIVEQFIRLAISGVALLAINLFYTKLFGNFFSNLLKDGSSFSWILFLVATVVILIFSVVVIGISPKKIGRGVARNLSNIVKHQLKKSHSKQVTKSDEEDQRFVREIKDSFKAK